MPKTSIEMMNYKIVNQTNDEGEIIFYGQVIEEMPRDWFTGEKMDGMFISLEEFMTDLEQLKTKDKLTIRMNSCGGDFNTGVVIHNLLKDLKAYKTGIIDGLAASAASIIACACDELQVFPSSRFMIHETQAGLCGWFTGNDLNKVINQLESCRVSMLQIYQDKSGKKEKELETLIDAETWFVGQTIIDNGFADKLILDEKQDIKMQIENNGKILIANGVKHDISTYKNFPKEDLNIKEENLIEKITNKVINSLAKKQENAQIVQGGNIKTATEEVSNIAKSKEIQEKGGSIVAKTIEELRNECPELVAQIEDAATETAKKAAVETERKRLQEIESIEASIADTELINAAKYGETACTAAELAMQSMQKQAALGTAHLENIKKDAVESNTNKVEAAANGGTPGVGDDKTELVNKLSTALKAQFGGNK